MSKKIFVVFLFLSLAVGGFWLATQRPNQANTSTIAFAGGDDTSGFARAFEPRDFQFPLDHGPHFEYQTEWWYYTGNLTGENGDHYGYQLTFFRRGLTPGVSARGSEFGTNQIYFAHFALTNAAGNKHTFVERFSRGAAGLAGGAGEPFRVWLEDWSAQALDEVGDVIRLQAHDEAMTIDLTLQAAKPIVAHGDGGLSPKSDEPGNASYYLSFTRLATTGQVTADGQTAKVSGESWFDHEWSTSALGPHGLGWDWFSLQLSDGRELMFFQVRRDDGGIEPVSGGTVIEKDGKTRHLSADEIKLAVKGTWASPDTKAEYPARWQISIPSAQIELTIEPWVAAQEMRVSFTYWEGAVKLSGLSNGAAVTGNGYVELTGYKRSMQGVF